MELRVEDLAQQAGVSVDTIRYYQSRGLIGAPQRRGRVAIYATEHLDALTRIRSLQDRGLSLRVIGRILQGDIEPADVGLAEAVAAATQGGDNPTLTLDELAEESGVPTALLKAVEQAGLLIGREIGGTLRYTVTDIEVVRSGLALLEAGFPLNDLLELATSYDKAARGIAAHAVELFDKHVREPILNNSKDGTQAANELIEAFGSLLPAVTDLVAHHFRRVLLALAEQRFGEPQEMLAEHEAR